MDELTVATSCTGYGVYLRDWAESIREGAWHPAATAIFTHGTENDRAAGVAASALLRDAGIPCRHEHDAERLDLGVARNRAIELTATAWVQHLDADDMLMPHAVEEFARIAPQADVISAGYERVGDLAAGPNQRVKTYRTHRGQATLDDPTPASGVSPFRRALWEQAPYRTDMLGGWDTALWIGFARLDARFVPTRRAVVRYRQHGDSIFNQRRRGGWVADVVGAQLQGLRRGDAGVSILVPWAGADPHRQAAWAHVERGLRAVVPEWEIVVGVCPTEPWRKGVAVSDALHRAHGSILVVLDADCVIAASALREAVDRVTTGAPWAVPHDLVYRLTAEATADWMARDADDPVAVPSTGWARSPYTGFAGGGCFVVSRATYQASRGIPAGFAGWGGEDTAFALVLDTLAGPHWRGDAPLVHLWHPPQERAPGGGGTSNRALSHAYRTCRGNPELMYALITGGRALAGSPTETRADRAARASSAREGITMRHSSHTSFAERTLAQQRALRDREAAAQARQAHVATYHAAQQARASARLLRRAGIQDTMDRGEEIPAHDSDIDRPALTVPFASHEAGKLAAAHGLTDAAFVGHTPAHERGYTARQVRDLTEVAVA